MILHVHTIMELTRLNDIIVNGNDSASEVIYLPSNVATIPTKPDPAPSSITFLCSKTTFPVSKYSQRTIAYKKQARLTVKYNTLFNFISSKICFF